MRRDSVIAPRFGTFGDQGNDIDKHNQGETPSMHTTLWETLLAKLSDHSFTHILTHRYVPISPACNDVHGRMLLRRTQSQGTHHKNLDAPLDADRKTSAGMLHAGA